MRVRTPLALVTVTAGLALSAAPALASSSDAAATQAYVQADYALVRVARSHLASSEAGPLQILARVRRECPGAGAGSPQDPESTQMSDEVIGAMVLSAAKPDLQAIRAFVHAAAGLSWSEHALTSAVHGYVRKLNAIFSLPTPDLCGDVRAWAADGYRALPASTVSFVARFMPVWVALGYQPSQLARFESSTVSALARRARPLEGQLAEGEARAVERWGEIMNTLQLWP